MKNKSGITLTSLVVYLVLFTIFTVFSMNLSTNLNEGLLNDRGASINYSDLIKLKTNIEISALNSNDVTYNNNQLSYSNGDIYRFDAIRNVVLKNGGVLLSNVSAFNTTLTEANSSKKVSILVTLNKYSNILNFEIVNCVEE